ncbi:MAG: class I SAM-dependent methyltransferase, partial [Phycisphaerae bacterium]
FIANAATLQAMSSGLTRLVQPLHRVFHWRRENTRDGSRRNIAAHYDLGNDFYKLWLDDTMAYSAGIFETHSATMRDASIAKMDRLCRKLRLTPSDHLLEIGTGWGGLAIHAAQQFGCRVTTTTISRRQFEFARERVAALGLADRVTVLREDYRDLRGQYDKLVSVEMIEAVGHQYFDTFFRKVSGLLRPHGQACIQAITVADRFYEHARRDVDFIKRYIFPGSCLPSIAVMSDSIARVTDMTITHVEDITAHYARTLRLWRDAFLARHEQVRALGLPQSFIRMWEFYLCYCEAGFAQRTIGTVQMSMVKPAAAYGPTLGTI